MEKTYYICKVNQYLRTATIRFKEGNKTIAKYRTLPLSDDEMIQFQNNYQSDIENFLKTSDWYYKVS